MCANVIYNKKKVNATLAVIWKYFDKLFFAVSCLLKKGTENNNNEKLVSYTY